MKPLKYIGISFVFIWFMVGGIGHFVRKEMFVHIMPPYIPYALAIVYISGFFEILGAIGLWAPRLREWAGNGLIALTICVTPANVYMWVNPSLFPEVSERLLGVRLIVQVLLLALIWWATRSDANKATSHVTVPRG